MGATTGAIVRQLSTDFGILIIISSVISAPAAWWAMQRWLENYPYRVALNAWVFLLATAFVLLTAVVTVSFQTIKAASANPVNSLRSE